jgi:hypothetical protein
MQIRRLPHCSIHDGNHDNEKGHDEHARDEQDNGDEQGGQEERDEPPNEVEDEEDPSMQIDVNTGSPSARRARTVLALRGLRAQRALGNTHTSTHT